MHPCRAWRAHGHDLEGVLGPSPLAPAPRASNGHFTFVTTPPVTATNRKATPVVAFRNEDSAWRMTADPACVPMPHRLSECASCIDRMSEARDETASKCASDRPCQLAPAGVTAGRCAAPSGEETDRVARGRRGVQQSADHPYARARR